MSREDLPSHPRSFASPLEFPMRVYTASRARLHFRPFSPAARASRGRLTGLFPSATLWLCACDSLGLSPSPTPTSVLTARRRRQEGPCPTLILTPPTSWPHPHTGPTHIHTYLAEGKLRPQVPQDTPKSDGSPRLVLAPDQLFPSPRSTAFLIDQGPYLIKNLIQTSLSCPG